jgi:predicted O-linked N-acetylglucosamine transferase (SPINDLY family)
MTARNAPCPCGSGKKYKRCHGQTVAGSPAMGNAQQILEQARLQLQKNRLDEALALARRLPDGLPKYQLLVQIFLSRRQTTDFRQAEKVLRQWISADPGNPEPGWRRIDLHLFQNDLPAAGRALAAVRGKASAHANTHYYQAVIRQLQGDPNTAMSSYREAVQIDTRADLGEKELEVEAAVEMFETAAGEYPGSPGSDETRLIDCVQEFNILNNALNAWQTGFDPAVSGLTPQQITRYGNARYNLGCVCMADFERDEEAREQFRLGLEINPDHELARLNTLFMLNYSEHHDEDALWQAHRETGAWLRDRHGVPFNRFRNDMDPDKPLRIGYLSSDFRKHSVAYFILPVLAAHDHRQFSLYLYHNDQRMDELTARARQYAARFSQVHMLSDRQLLEKIRNDRIDILVDLNGLTRGHRMGVLAERAAPVQVSWMGYPNTTGLDSVDYRITDQLTDPAGEADARYAESLLRIEPVFSVYEPPADMPEPGEAPSLATGTFTFGSFNFMPKINTAVLQAWARILQQAPGARLLIKNMVLDFEQPEQRLQKALQRVGIDSARVDLVGRTPAPRDHYLYYHRVDACLDTFPYNGTTTTCDSLYMGVPVVALLGSDHRSRVSASQLSAVGLNSLVARSVDEYVDIAVKLAMDRTKLNEVRSGLRQRMQASALMDHASFTHELEARYRKIWLAACAKSGR